MKTDVAPSPLPLASSRRVRPAFLEGALLSRLERLRLGRLELEWRGTRNSLGAGGAGELQAEVRVLDERFFAACALRGSIGAGEAWASGWWTSPAPENVVRLFVRNRDTMSGLEGGLARGARALLAFAHGLRRNTRTGSRANIAAHYDLSNGFFSLFLDETMTYSCGIFARPDASLKEASLAKIDRLCRRLELSSRDHLLEIGTGWGAFALHAAREYGCRVTTTTISKEQHALAAERIAAAGLGERVTLLQRDYRDLEGTYDKLVSVEMIEAVGHQYYGTFFETCARLLKPDGRLALQAITIADSLYDEARRSVDFIQACIFPGSCIPSVGALVSAAGRSSDLVLDELEELGPHYVRTLAAWRANLRANWARALELGISEQQLRLFEFYFAYCEGGYAEGQLGNVQMRFARPEARRVRG